MFKQALSGVLPQHIVELISTPTPTVDECVANTKLAARTVSAEYQIDDLTATDGVPMLERLAAVEQMLRDCLSHREIELECVTRWGVRPRAARYYIKKIHDDWKLTTEKHREREFEQIKATFTEIAKRALKDGDFKAAAYATRQKADLVGLTVERVQVSINGNVAHTLSLDDAAQRVSEASSLIELAQRRSLALEAHAPPPAAVVDPNVMDGEIVE